MRRSRAERIWSERFAAGALASPLERSLRREPGRDDVLAWVSGSSEAVVFGSGDLVRLRSGELQDDVSIVLCREAT